MSTTQLSGTGVTGASSPGQASVSQPPWMQAAAQTSNNSNSPAIQGGPASVPPGVPAGTPTAAAVPPQNTERQVAQPGIIQGQLDQGVSLFFFFFFLSSLLLFSCFRKRNNERRYKSTSKRLYLFFLFFEIILT
jgi:hypothetical protein